MINAVTSVYQDHIHVASLVAALAHLGVAVARVTLPHHFQACLLHDFDVLREKVADLRGAVPRDLHTATTAPQEYDNIKNSTVRIGQRHK
jgi:hypothetical protein